MGKVALGTDHAGLEIKEKIRVYLIGQGYDVMDFGTNSFEPVDYPVYADRVAKHIQETPGDLGVLICGSGIGMSIAANRYKGIYAARCVNASEAETARRSGANVLCLRGRSTIFEDSMLMVDTFLITEFSGEERHKKRLAQIDGLVR